MIEYANIQKQFNDVISYSQEYTDLHTDALLRTWAEKKEKFYHMFGDKLIYDAGPIVLHLQPEVKRRKVNDFLEKCNYDYKYINGNEASNVNKLAEFVSYNRESFFDNVVSISFIAPDGTTISPGMKLTRAFKYFISDKDLLDIIQTEASRVIQEDRIEGNLCFSIHPLDFLSSSENTYNWRSCHALDGEYRSGNLSYMVDSCTVITYVRGDDGVKLPNFPTSVPWNSKKWRMLLFISQNQTCLFAGRQYPMDLGYGILDILLSNFTRMTGSSPSYWSNWHDDKITEFTYKNDIGYRDSGTITPHVIINGYIYKMTRLIKDVKGSKHFNDLLHSSCYTARYCWLKGSNFIPEFNIGGPIPCPKCGNNNVDYQDIMLCGECADTYGYGDNYTTCYDCGRRIHMDDAYWVDCIGAYVCYSCYNHNYFTCDRCGDIYPNDDRVEDDNGSYYCRSCASHLGIEY